MAYKIAILARQGLLLERFLTLLADSPLAESELSLVSVASDYSAQSAMYKGRPLGFSLFDDADLSAMDLLIVMESTIVVEAYGEKLKALNCPVLGLAKNLQALDCELIAGGRIPESRVVGIPEPSVVALMTVLQEAGVESMDARMLLSAEVYDEPGVAELAGQTARLLNAKPLENRIFSKQLPFNLYPLAENSLGLSLESTITEQISRAFAMDEVCLTAVQAPVFHGQTLLVSVVLDKPVDIEDLENRWQLMENIDYVDKVQELSHLRLSEVDQSMVLGQVRVNKFDAHHLSFWLTLDEYQVTAAEGLLPLAQQLLKIS